MSGIARKNPMKKGWEVWQKKKGKGPRVKYCALLLPALPKEVGGGVREKYRTQKEASKAYWVIVDVGGGENGKKTSPSSGWGKGTLHQGEGGKGSKKTAGGATWEKKGGGSKRNKMS